GKNSRIFQDKSVCEIVDEILARHCVRGEWRVRKVYPRREYCTQYRESDYEFVTRLLAEDGLFFFFVQPPSSGPLSAPNADDESVETLVLADGTFAYADLPGGATLIASDPEPSAREDSLSVFTLRKKVGPESVYLREYDFRNPKLYPWSRSIPNDTANGT